MISIKRISVFFFFTEVEYKITIKTGDQLNSGTNGPVHIQIFGDDHRKTEKIHLNNANNGTDFQQNSSETIKINDVDIGKPQYIIIEHEDQTNGWYIEYVQIEVHNFLLRFSL